MEESKTLIVSGTARSGTSVMMRILKDSGVKILFDNFHKADKHNPYGYYEYSLVERTLRGINQEKEHQDVEWIENAVGGAVKILPNILLKGLPLDRKYAVIFMKRDFSESAKSFLNLRKEGFSAASLDLHYEDAIIFIQKMMEKNSKLSLEYIKSKPENFSLIEVEMNKLNEQIGTVNEFVNKELEQNVSLVVPVKDYPSE